MRYTNLDNLPKIKNTNSINWKGTIGIEVSFEYDDIVGNFKIIDYANKKAKIIYNDEVYTIGTGDILCCKLFKVVKKKNPNYVKIGINDIPTTANWMIKFFQGGEEEAIKYNRTTNKKIYPICPNCGSIKKEPISISELYRTKKFTCICSDNYSFPNKIMFNILEYLKIDFNIEKRFSWCIYKLNDGAIFINKNFKTKKVEIFKDDISLGKFESMSELVRVSKEYFNTIFNVSNISISAKNNKTYKGYTFKFIE